MKTLSAGKLRAGDRLPTHRELASALGKVPVRLFCPETYDRCRGEAQLKLGGDASTVRFALGSGER